jgi:hypothetical protein
MSFIFPVHPYPDESLAGFVVRAAATNLRRSPSRALRCTGIRCSRVVTLCGRSPAFADPIARWAGTPDVQSIARMFQEPLADRRGWINFFGEPLRAFYCERNKRRIAPGALKDGEYVRAIWSLRPFTFDPFSKEELIDRCPQCGRDLGWGLTFGVAYRDYCSRPEQFGTFRWHYPGLDLRDFPQPKVKVEDEEALDFLTGLIDPLPGRKEKSRLLVPAMWSSLTNGNLFEVALTFASMLSLETWDQNLYSVRRKARAGESWGCLITPRMLSIGGRTVMRGQSGFEELGDILRREAENKPRYRTFGKLSEFGPLSITNPSLSVDAKEALALAVESYIEAKRDPDMQPLQVLADKYGVNPKALKSLADSGLIPIIRVDNAKPPAPVLMSEAALAPLIYRIGTLISGARAASMIGLHQMYLEELERFGLLEKADGPVLKLLKCEAYYSRVSVEALNERISKQVRRRPPRISVRLKVALRALNVRSVPWAGIVQAIADGCQEVFALKPRGPLGDRLAVRDTKALAATIERERARGPFHLPEYVGKATAAELLSASELVVWRLMQVGKLKRHVTAPLYSPFKRCEVERLAGKVIFAPEIVQIGSFQTYREASTWLKKAGIAPLLQLKDYGWKVYSRAKVMSGLRKRAGAFRSEPPRRVPMAERELVIGGAYPIEMRRRLLDRVRKGSSIRQAAIALRINYVTAVRWVKKARSAAVAVIT